MDVVLALLAAFTGALTLGTIAVAESVRSRARLRLRGLMDAELGHYELAYLAGGPARVADTALGLLAAEGEIRVARTGRLYPVSTAVSAGYAVEEQVLAILAGRAGGRTVAEVKRQVATGREVAEIRKLLVGLGLLVDPRAVPGLRECRTVLRAIAMATVPVMVADLLIMIAMGTKELSLAALFGFGASRLVSRKADVRYARGRPLTLGRAGRRLLREARAATPHGTAGDATALALYGLSHLGAPEMSDVLSRRVTQDGHLYPAQAGGSGDASGGCGFGPWFEDGDRTGDRGADGTGGTGWSAGCGGGDFGGGGGDAGGG
ncbi:TIGR04222 domain-containing membrane protein [Nonomuraea sp. NN258]|nr:TIGR04222 domain-containing membrane protein [Nonomuraea antri]